jgi:type I restriction enzyme, S subunit
MNSHYTYKPTNQNWMGHIPSHWSIKRLKYLTQVRKELSEHGTEELLSVTETRGIVKRKELQNTDENISRSENLRGYRLVRKSDLVNNIMLVWKRGLGVSQYEGIVSPAYSVFSFKDDCDPNFFNYLLRSDEYISEFRRHSTGITMSRLRLYDDSFGNVFAHLPPIEEQKLISQYLDKKTSQIDSLVEKIQKKIELFKEQRTSLINHYVTKGLDPNVEMKDSGVEWIGEIPKHWEVISIKRLFTIYFGGSWGDEPTDKQIDHIVRVVRVTEFDMNYLEVSKEIPTLRSLELLENSHKLLKNGDIILEKSGGGEKTPVGRAVLYRKTSENKVINSNFTNVCRPNMEVVDPFFCVFLLFSLYSGGATARNIKQTTGIQNLDLDGFMSEKVFIPSLGEQVKISSRIIDSNKLNQNLVQKNLVKINLLKEYRQSLISSAVTGKVRISEDMI